jgi:quinol monooxygenase YgiN
MSLAQAMKAHEDHLRSQVTALDVPVTEVVIFKLLIDATDEALNAIRKDFLHNAAAANGLIRLSWSQSLDDPKSIVMFFDWRRIQDHWEFWQQPEFEAIFASITKWFEPGAPIVHHYAFDTPGMIDTECVRVLIWNNGVTSLPADLIEQVCGKDERSEQVLLFRERRLGAVYCSGITARKPPKPTNSREKSTHIWSSLSSSIAQ